MRISVLWKPFDQTFYANMKTEALLGGLGDDTGRLLQLEIVRRLLDGAVRFVDPALGAEKINEISDVVVLVGASPELAQSLGVDIGFLSKLGTPVVALDLAVEKPEDSVEWLKALAAGKGKPANIWVNSKPEMKALEGLGIHNVACGASISQFLNAAPDLGSRIAANWQNIQAPEAICVVAGLGNRTRPVERDLLALAMAGPLNGRYIVQSGTPNLQIARGEFGLVEQAEIGALRKRSMPEATDQKFRQFCMNSVTAHFNAAAWMESYRRFDIVAGCSFQGVALALQTQRMGLAIVDDDVFEGKCAQAGLPYIRVHDFEPGASRQYLKDVIKFTPERFSAIRKNAIESLSSFLEGQKIDLRPPFLRLLKG